MAEQITNSLGESCIGCEHLHLHLQQYRCFKAKHAVEGEFICWLKIGTHYPKPIRNRERCYKAR